MLLSTWCACVYLFIMLLPHTLKCELYVKIVRYVLLTSVIIRTEIIFSQISKVLRHEFLLKKITWLLRFRKARVHFCVSVLQGGDKGYSNRTFMDEVIDTSVGIITAFEMVKEQHLLDETFLSHQKYIRFDL